MQNEKGRFLFWLKILVTCAALVLLVIHFKTVCLIIKEVYSILLPFLAGGVIAFILNIPMRGIEKLLFSKAKSKFAQNIKRPVSIILTLLFFCALGAFLSVAVIPQVTETIKTLPEQITGFYYSALEKIQALMEQYPQITQTLMVEIEKLQELKINWQEVIGGITDFFMSGFGGSFIKNTFSVVGKIGNGVLDVAIAAIFSIYILAQKEKLGNQGKRILSAFLSEENYGKVMKVISLLGNNFSNFIAGQCIEAVILGLLIMIVMLIFGFDYVLLVGVLVAFTALIPVVGGFIGGGIGAFLFLMQDPLTALWFVILFVIVQQIEGNLIYPYVVGNSVGLPSMWILAAITIGGSVMGVAGMLFFIPLCSTAYMLLRDSVNDKNDRKGWVKEAWDTDYLPISEEEQKKKGVGGMLVKITDKAKAVLGHKNQPPKAENVKKNPAEPKIEQIKKETPAETDKGEEQIQNHTSVNRNMRNSNGNNNRNKKNSSNKNNKRK